MKTKTLITTLIAAATMASTAWSASNDIYVSNDYNSSTEGWGTTHFSNYDSAYAYATANNINSAILNIEKNSSLSGFTFDNNHKNYSKLSVVVEDGASMGNALSKWDMTYAVTIKAGGNLVMARPKSASVSNVHLKNKLIVGEAGSTKKANLHFLSDDYQDGDISIRYNGSLTAYNADITVQDLDAQGRMSLTDSTVKVDGALATATFFKTELIRTEMTVGGTQISGGLSDFSGGSANRLGNFSMTDSTLTFGEGAVVNVAGSTTLTNSFIAADVLNNKKTISLTNSTLTVETLENNGTIKVSGNSCLEADVVTGNKIVVLEGASLTISSNSLLSMIDNSANEASGSGNIAFNKVDEAVETSEITLKALDGKSVELSSGAEEIVINSAIEIANTSEIEAISGGIVLSAWSFDIENGTGDNKVGVTVTMDVGDIENLEDIRIYHEEGGDWTDVTNDVTGKKLENGKVSFTTNKFSGYAAVAIPEPSMFGLLAGLGALALVGARRRRR